MESPSSSAGISFPHFTPKNTESLSFYPITYPELFKHYKILEKTRWSPDEINYTTTLSEWGVLNDTEKKYAEFILLLFSQLDGVVNANLMENFIKDTSFIKECSFFYTIQSANELVHSETYSLLLKGYLGYKTAKEFDAIKHNPAVAAIAEWTYSWMQRSRSLLERIVAFICLEGIIFSSAFAGIYWFKSRNLLGCLTTANEWIARDEGEHTRFGITLYKVLVEHFSYEPLPSDRIKEIINSAVGVVAEFTKAALGSGLIGLSYERLMQYVEFVSDSVSGLLDADPIYGSQNPFTFMNYIDLDGKGNFFEKVVTAYSMGVNNGLSQTEEDLNNF